MKKFLVIAVLLVLGWGAWKAWSRRSQEEAKPAFTPVAVSRGDLFIGVQASGVVEPQNRVVMRPPLAGRVEEVLAREGDWVKRGQVLAWLSSSERAALLDAARERGPEELERWQQLYRPTPLVAPITGTVIARMAEPGQSVSQADTVLVVSDRLIVKAQVDETDIARVKVGQKARITLDAYPDSKVAARVDHVAFEARNVNNVTIYDVEAAAEKVPPHMRSGMTASVEFEAESRRGVLLLPVDAVRQEKGEDFVRLGSVTRAVRTGLSDGVNIEIVKGLKEGDEVLMPSTELPTAAKVNNPFMPQRQPRAGRRGGSR